MPPALNFLQDQIKNVLYLNTKKKEGAWKCEMEACVRVVIHLIRGVDLHA
jgi:hypothetical protein